MAKVTVSLSELPKNREFEEFLAAYFQCGGYYVERNIIEREIDEVLELDIIITNYNVSPPTISFAEAKSGTWGFEDIFKVKGWMDYTSITRAWIVTQTPKSNPEFYREKADFLGIRLIQNADLKDTIAYFRQAFGAKTIELNDIACWRYSYWAERQLIKYLVSCKKADRVAKRFPGMSKYYQAINGGIFFTKNITNRLLALYAIFKEFPRLSAKVAHEMQGEDFELDHETIPKDVFSITFYKCDLTDIHVSTFIENCSRLTILKNAVDFVLYRRLGDSARTTARMKVLGQEFDKFLWLPSTFQAALSQLAAHKYFDRYPIFWQWFLWFFGGFILLDYKDQEYEYMSQMTGIPIEEIPNALSAFDILFPIGTPWLYTQPTSNISLLRMHSTPFMGIGANHRRLRYTKDASFQSLNLTGQHTLDDLIKWNNLLVHLLDRRF